jgi:small subunit ribosomal protein S17
LADEERSEQVEQETPVEAEASAEAPPEPAPETPPEEPGPPVPEPESPEPTPEPAPPGEPVAAEGQAAPADEQPATAPANKRKRLPRSQRRQRPKPKREQTGERKPITRLPKPEHERGRRQERRGVVVSAAMDKTIVVRVDVVKAHPRYKKVVRRSQRFHAHDERNEAKPGDVVRIVEIRPLSKTKNWRLAEIVEVAK